MLTSACETASNAALRLPEMNYVGSLQTTALMRQQLNGDSEWVVQQTATTGIESYIWQPWLVRTRGRLSVAYDQTGGSNESQAMTGSGEATIAVLPLSKYPVTFDFSHVDSRVEGDFSGDDYTRDRVAVNARAAITQTLRAGLRASYDQVSRSSGSDLSAINTAFDITKTFGAEDGLYGLRSLGFVAQYQGSEFSGDPSDPADEDGSGQTALAQFTLGAEPTKNMTFNSVSSYLYDTEDSDGDSFSRNTMQSVNTLQWRPEELPFIVTGTFRALAEQIAYDDSSNSDSNTFLLAGTGGLSWPVNDNLSVTAGLRASYESNDAEQGAPSDEGPVAVGSSFNASGLLGYSYYSDSRDVSGFDWRWDSRGSVDAGVRTDAGFVTRDTLAFGHKFERTFDDFFLAPLRFSIGEDVELRFETDQDQPFGAALNHSLGLTYSAAESGSSSLAQIILRDSRELIRGDDEFQMLQGRVNQRWAFDQDKSLRVEFSGQAMRQVSEAEDEMFLTLNANAVYADREFLGVEGLNFNSEMRLNVTGLNDLIGEREGELADEFLRNDWRNVLRYRIGRLSLSTEATAFHTDQDLGYLFLVRLRRDFGGSG